MKRILSFDCDLADDFQVIAISSHLKDYKLCWNLNNILKTDLRKHEDFEFGFKKNSVEVYSFYYFYTPDLRCNYYMLANKKNKSFIINKLNSTDYLLLIKGFMQSADINHIIQSLKKTTNFLTAFLVDTSNMKNEMNFFLSELEIHCIKVLDESNHG